MSKEKKEDIMTPISTVELPIAERKRLIQAEVNEDLFNEASGLMKKQNLKIRQVMEYGLKAFIAKSKEKSGLPKKK